MYVLKINLLYSNTRFDKNIYKSNTFDKMSVESKDKNSPNFE